MIVKIKKKKEIKIKKIKGEARGVGVTDSRQYH
jgi:hypothetical protein